MQILLEHGADANAEDNSGWSALNFRISKLLSGNQDDFDSDEEERSIDWNPRVTEDEYVKLLLSKGATFDRNNKFYSRLFDQAMSTGDEDLVNLFLSNIGDINSEKRILCSPAAKGNVIMVNLLISKGATINTDPSYGWTPLHSAAARNQAETAKLLISKGADVNTAVSANKQTPLLVAAIYGHVDVADVLLSNGANVNSTNQYGDTPISIAVGKDDVDMIRLLVEKGAVLPESAAQYKGKFPEFTIHSLRLLHIMHACSIFQN